MSESVMKSFYKIITGFKERLFFFHKLYNRFILAVVYMNKINPLF